MYYKITNTEEIKGVLQNLKHNPYKKYKKFKCEIGELLRENQKVFFDLFKICENNIINNNLIKTPKSLIMLNCPIDDDLPIYDLSDPVNDKYKTKKTFVGEAFLEVVSEIFSMPILSYTTRNNGDYFQDVYPHKDYFSTQTQKTDSDLFYHNDRTAHPIRADYLLLLGMRSCGRNTVYTTYIDGKNILDNISEDMRSLLRKPFFTTPFDLISKDSNSGQVESGACSILYDDNCIRYYDGRTEVHPEGPDIAWKAIVELKNAILNAPKNRVNITEGCLFLFPNTRGLHGREILCVSDKQALRNRYLLKTYNFASVDRCLYYRKFFVEGNIGLVDDDLIK